MILDINVKEMVILGVPGVPFEDRKIFTSVWYALSTNMIEGWEPTAKDVERLKSEAIALGAAS